MKKEFIEKFKHIYFIGIGGISMSGLAEILMTQGFIVSGSDVKVSQATKRLEQKGIAINQGHRAQNITNEIDLVVYTAAVKGENPELLQAQALSIPIMDRAHLLGLIMADYKNSIAIAGTHGKTTTTSMISEILLMAELDPTITLGGILPAIKSNIRVGKSPYFVAEACEYCDSFLQFYPKVGVILNVEEDHLDYFKDLEGIRRSFSNFGKNVPNDGLVIADASIIDVKGITDCLLCKKEYFGLEVENANWQAKSIRHDKDGRSFFKLYYNDENLGDILLNIPGDHNIKNALAACAAVNYFGVPFTAMARGLEHFGGTNRRFEHKGEKNGVVVIDDYAHHPTEITAMLSAAKNIKSREIWCVFQPHTFSRTKYLFEGFTKAFTDADHIIITDIFAAREAADDEITAPMLATAIAHQGKDAIYIKTFSQIQQHLAKNLAAGDLLITVGAGNVHEIGEIFLGLKD